MQSVLQPVKFAPIALSMIIALSFGSVAFAQESKTNVNKDASLNIHNNNNNVKPIQKPVTNGCTFVPFC